MWHETPHEMWHPAHDRIISMALRLRSKKQLQVSSTPVGRSEMTVLTNDPQC